MLEEYKDANPNFTIRRREEQQREENQQLEMLRQVWGRCGILPTVVCETAAWDV